MQIEKIGDCTLYLGDCLEVMATLDPVSHVIGDPPYEKEAHKKGRRTQASVKRGVNADLDFVEISETLRDDASAAARRLSQGWVIWFCQAEAVGDWRDSLESAGAKYKRTMIWVKPDSTPQLNGQMPAPGYESMPLAWCGVGHSRWNAGGKRGVYTHLTNQKDRDGRHKTEKPVPLMRELLQDFTNPGETILDPFMGSGTTGVACARMGRKFIGIELDPKFFEVSCDRIRRAYAQDDMFLERPPRKPMAGLDLFANDNAPAPAPTAAPAPCATIDVVAFADSFPRTRSTPEQIAERISARRAIRFGKRFNAQRSAIRAIGPHAVEGVDFITTKAGDEWSWAPVEFQNAA